MSPVALDRDIPSAVAENDVDYSHPVERPRMSAWHLVRSVLDHGGPGYLQFAITNICNAGCDFCGFAVDPSSIPRARRSVTLQEARDVIDICAQEPHRLPACLSAASRWCIAICGR